MAEADPLQRVKAAARRSSGPVPVDLQRRWHFDALDRELGVDAETLEKRAQNAPRQSRMRIGHWIMLLLSGLLIWGGIILFQLWQDGRLGQTLNARRSAIVSESSAWMSGATMPTFGSNGKAGSPPADTGEAQDAPPNFIEPLLNPPAAPPVVAPPVAAVVAPDESAPE